MDRLQLVPNENKGVSLGRVVLEYGRANSPFIPSIVYLIIRLPIKEAQRGD